jgi:hypothetical protein
LFGTAPVEVEFGITGLVEVGRGEPKLAGVVVAGALL